MSFYFQVTYDGGVESSPMPLLTGSPDAPLVYVTMGTVFNKPGQLQTVVDGLADLEARVLVTVDPEGDPAVLRAAGRHVRVERYVPQSIVLSECDVVVSHAGSGKPWPLWFANGPSFVCLKAPTSSSTPRQSRRRVLVSR